MSIVVITTGFILDILFGDPLGKIHPVRGIGFVISTFEKIFFKKNGRFDRLKGVFLVITVLTVTVGITYGVIFVSYQINRTLGIICECIIAWSTLAAKSLKKESMKVYYALGKSVEKAREALSMIVGRDTHNLDEEEITKAAVETVAENASDGEICPLFYLALGGPLFAMAYKAVNTMDSMVGYKNDRYMNFGTAAARLDDIAGFIPSRLTALASVAAAFLLGYDAKGAVKSFKRDRNKTQSPNAGQIESVFAGALDISLGGRAVYFGKSVDKPVLGDDIRPVESYDIVRANRIMYLCSFICLLVFIATRVIVMRIAGVV